MFVKAGHCGGVVANDMDKVGVLQSVYRFFRKKIAKDKDTFAVLHDFAEGENGRIFEHITIDKIYRVERKGFWNSVGLGELFGIYLVSIHRKVSQGDDGSEYQLVWPTPSKKDYNVDLLRVANIRRLIKLLRPDCDDACVEQFCRFFLYDSSNPLGREEHFQRLDAIERSNDTEERKKALVREEDEIYLRYLQNDFKLDLDRRLDEFYSIRLSVFVSLLKEIAGEKCAINFIDYACHRVFPSIKDKSALQYLTDSDIENPPPYSRKWGGSGKPMLLSTFSKGGAKSTLKKSTFKKSTFRKGGAKFRTKTTFKAGRKIRRFLKK
jgi:hypothetical protein